MYLLWANCTHLISNKVLQHVLHLMQLPPWLVTCKNQLTFQIKPAQTKLRWHWQGDQFLWSLGIKRDVASAENSVRPRSCGNHCKHAAVCTTFQHMCGFKKSKGLHKWFTPSLPLRFKIHYSMLWTQITTGTKIWKLKRQLTNAFFLIGAMDGSHSVIPTSLNHITRFEVWPQIQTR